jgi:pimeloyl-ACP methyl ester carboxylesterase
MNVARVLRLPNGISTRILDSGGAGPTVILIHGLANSIEIWDRVLPRLAERCRVIAFDLPGFGKADRPDAPYDATFFAAQLEALMDALGIVRGHLVGSSLGASLIVRFSERNLARIDSTVLAAPGGFGRYAHPLMRLPALPIIGYQLGRPTRLNNALTIRLAMCDQRNATRDLIRLTNVHARIPGSHRAFVRTLRSGVGPFGVRDRDSFARLARALDRPTLVLWGRQDRVFGCAQSERAAALMPQAEIVLVDRCGHYPQWEQPEAFVAAFERHIGLKGGNAPA